METHEPQAGPLLVFGGRPLLASQHITSFPAPSFQPPTLVQSITSRTPGFKSCSAIMRSAIWGHLLTLSAPQFPRRADVLQLIFIMLYREAFNNG